MTNRHDEPPAMTPLDAAKILALPADATPEQIEARFLEFRAKLEDKIAKAPTPGLKDKYRQALALAAQAVDALVSAPQSSAELPSLTRITPPPTAIASRATAVPTTPPPVPATPVRSAEPAGEARPTPQARLARPSRLRSRVWQRGFLAALVVLAAGAAWFFTSPYWHEREHLTLERVWESHKIYAGYRKQIASIPLNAHPDYFDYESENIYSDGLLPGNLEKLQAALAKRKAKAAAIWAQDPNAAGDMWGTTKLYRAAEAGDFAAVRELLDRGADVNKVSSIYLGEGGSYSAPPLHAALGGGHERIVELLAGRGARFDLNCTRYGGALAAAVASGQVPLVTLAVSNQAPAKPAALFAAASGASPAMITAALQAGVPATSIAPPGDPDQNHGIQGADWTTGWNALHFLAHNAAQPESVECGRRLLAAGVNPRQKSTGSPAETPIELLERILRENTWWSAAGRTHAEALLRLLASPSALR